MNAVEEHKDENKNSKCVFCEDDDESINDFRLCSIFCEWPFVCLCGATGVAIKAIEGILSKGRA